MSFFSRFFSRKNKPNNISQTLEDVYSKIYNKEEKLSLNDLNILLKDKFNQKPLKSGSFNFNILNIKGCIFEIQDLNVITDKDNNIIDILVSCKDIVYDTNFRIIVPLSEFRLFLKEFYFKPPEQNKESEKERN